MRGQEMTTGARPVQETLERLDSNYHKTGPGDTGLLVRRLLGYGSVHLLVMGSWQEGTKDLSYLVDLLAYLKV